MYTPISALPLLARAAMKIVDHDQKPRFKNAAEIVVFIDTLEPQVDGKQYTGSCDDGSENTVAIITK